MEGEQLAIYTVNAFTTEPFGGNPASVCLLPETMSNDEALMQNIAMQMKHSETAFVTTRNAGDQFDTAKSFNLRWFTPTTEVQLCGHATLASAAVLFNVLQNPSPMLFFTTRWGVQLTARRSAADGETGRITLQLPLNAPQPVPLDQFQQLVKATVGKLPVKELQLSPTTKKLLVRLDDGCSIEDLTGLTPETSRLPELHDGSQVRGIIVTLRTTPASTGARYHFQSRYFAPWVGIPEDPVTGSAHTVLGPYWARELGTGRLVARQCSPRGGDLYLSVDRPGAKTDAAGDAAVVLQGKMRIK